MRGIPVSPFYPGDIRIPARFEKGMEETQTGQENVCHSLPSPPFLKANLKGKSSIGTYLRGKPVHTLFACLSPGRSTGNISGFEFSTI